MKTYQELKNNFFDEVGKIDLSKLSLSNFGGGLREYAELLKVMAEIPEKTKDEMFKESVQNSCCSLGFGGNSTPRIEEGGK